MHCKLIAMLLACLAQLASAESGILPLEASSFHPISFPGKPATRYQFKDGILIADVEHSASALLYSFKQIRSIQGISLEYRNKGQTLVSDAGMEASRAGDDSLLRIGLLLSGPKPFIPIFASTWIKATANFLNLPSDRMLYLFIGARHAPGQRWLSPYSSSIENIAVGDSLTADGWRKVEFEFDKALPVVGIWLMADGDDTGSTFSLSLKNLRLKN